MSKTPAEETEELRAIVQDAHGAIKDLTRLIREARGTIVEVKAAAADAVERDLGEAVAVGLKSYQESIEKAIEAATAAVDRRFDTIADIMLGEDKQSRRQGSRTLSDYAHEIVEKREVDG